MTGVVCGGPPTPIIDVQLVADGRTIEIRESHAFALRVGEAEIDVDPSAACALVPVAEEAGRYGDLVGPLATACRVSAPGDHVEVELRGNVLEQEQEVSIVGPITEEPRAGPGYRGPTEMVTTSVTAMAIAIGPDSSEIASRWQQDLIEERDRQQRERREREAAAARSREAEQRALAEENERRLHPGPLPLRAALFPLTVAGILFAVVATTQAFTTTGRALTLFGFANVATASFVWRRRRWFPELSLLKGTTRGKGMRWSLTKYWFAYGVLMASGALVPFVGAPALPWYGLGLGGFGLFGVLVVLQSDQPAVGTAGHLLSAPALSPDAPAGTYGAVEGTFSGSLAVTTAIKIRFVDTGRTLDNGTRESRMTYQWSKRWGADRDTAIDVGGVKVPLGLEGAEFAGTRIDVTRNIGLRWGPEDGTCVVRVRQGDPLLVLGRLSPDGALQAAGPGSLILFSCGPGSSPRRTLRYLRLKHYLGLALMMVAAAATIVVGFAG